MTEETIPTPAKKAPFWLDFGPLLVFFVAFQVFKRTKGDAAMIWAAGVFAAVAVLALAFAWIRSRHTSPILIFSTSVICAVALFSAITGDKTAIFMKPTLMNVAFGLAVLGGVVLKKNVIQMMFRAAFQLPQKNWNVLAIAWGLFFFAMAGINEFVWRTQTEDFWIGFKVFGFMPMTIAFTLLQIPYIAKHGTIKTES